MSTRFTGSMRVSHVFVCDLCMQGNHNNQIRECTLQMTQYYLNKYYNYFNFISLDLI